MFTIVDLVLYTVIVAMLAMLLVCHAADGWSELEKKSAEALQRDIAFGSVS
ncbi:hypothetical protein [Rothia sp. LK2492]|uniref:hypothetical protein n=1 Tax=Rothia sp. LK2492 TaxID=3114370 RepID=UPI0034CEB97F